MSTVLAAASPALRTANPLRVMVVDDAIVVRSLLARWVDAEPDMEVIASLRTGREAVAQIEQCDADVVVLDIDMPELDGISALPLLLQKKRDLVVIMVSTFTRRSAEISLRALALGAKDYIPKPETTREATTSVEFRRELIEKIRTLGRHRFAPRAYARAPTPGTAPISHGKQAPALRARKTPLHDAVPLQLRPFSPVPPRVLLI
ncbi:MAG: response regulator, partial [Xanthobacteraceae bacterium]